MDHFAGTLGGAFEFSNRYQCFSTAVSGRDLPEGDKIILPPSALGRLSQMNVEYPMVFEIKNEVIDKTTHTGCLTFTSLEGECYMPYWKMEIMAIEEGQPIKVKYVRLEKATYIKFRAQSCDFLLISDHKAVLESSLRSFTCVTSGDMICIFHDDKQYELEVLEVQPNGAACIVETDCHVDFIEPVGYKEWKALQDWEAAKAREQQETATALGGNTWSGNGNVEGKGRVLQKAREETKETKVEAFRPFGGTAQRLGGRSLESIALNTRPSSSLLSSTDYDKKESDGGNGDSIASDDGTNGVSGVDHRAGSVNNDVLKEGVELICSDGTKRISPAIDNGSAPVREDPTVVSVPAPPLPSRIGSKFSTKKAVSKLPPQFIGEGHVLGGEKKPRHWRCEQEGPFKEEKQADK